MSKEKLDSNLGCMYTVIGTLLIPVAMMTNGLALMWAWNWLAVPTFDMPALTYLQAVIINFLLLFVRKGTQSNNKMETDDDLMRSFKQILAKVFLAPIVNIVIALVLKLFI